MMDTPFLDPDARREHPTLYPHPLQPYIYSSMFHFGVDCIHSTKEPQHDLPSLAPPKGEMARSFSWTSLFKSPTPTTLCLGDPSLPRLNQVISVSMCETEFCATKSIFCSSQSHISAHIQDKT